MDSSTTAFRIKALCKSKKITIKSLLEKTSNNRNFMYDLEKGGQVPSADKFERIADCLGCSVDYLLGRTDCPDLLTYDKDGRPMILEAMSPPKDD